MKRLGEIGRRLLAMAGCSWVVAASPNAECGKGDRKMVS